MEPSEIEAQTEESIARSGAQDFASGFGDGFGFGGLFHTFKQAPLPNAEIGNPEPSALDLDVAEVVKSWAKSDRYGTDNPGSITVFPRELETLLRAAK